MEKLLRFGGVVVEYMYQRLNKIVVMATLLGAQSFWCQGKCTSSTSNLTRKRRFIHEIVLRAALNLKQSSNQLILRWLTEYNHL